MMTLIPTNSEIEKQYLQFIDEFNINPVMQTSKVVYQWYEQGTEEYRTNNWGRMFPGSIIDVCEWCECLKCVSYLGKARICDDCLKTLEMAYENLVEKVF